ncbi:MAG TPA: hypothetical protein VFL13_12570 [Candidatus Baltobacteraceae bacterium]|nr:hypothetical protein [Candidatus Baltobacteraceae bacterium]
MIVTRQRRKKFPWKRVLYFTGFFAVLFAALWWTPSRVWLARGPVTTPVWNATAPVWKPLSKPFDMASQQSTIASQAAEIQRLNAEVTADQTKIADRDKQISQLTSQVNQAQQDAAVPHVSKPAGSVPANPTPQQVAVVSGDLTQSATPDMRRTAQEWGAMDSEAAAKVVERLPDAYVARIFALMTPDSVGAILENLPPGYAARLTQEHPELKR